MGNKGLGGQKTCEEAARATLVIIEDAEGSEVRWGRLFVLFQLGVEGETKNERDTKVDAGRG